MTGWDSSFDVAVVGLDPVGELAALLAAREGLQVLAVERELNVYSRPRVGVLDGEALRTLQKASVYDRAGSDMISGAGVQWASRCGTTLATTMPTEAHWAIPGCRRFTSHCWTLRCGKRSPSAAMSIFAWGTA